MRRTRENTLECYWSKREKDLIFRHPDYAWNGALVHHVFCSPRPRQDLSGVAQIVWDPSFVKELDARGYDITTLRFSIMKKPKVSDE